MEIIALIIVIWIIIFVVASFFDPNLNYDRPLHPRPLYSKPPTATELRLRKLVWSFIAVGLSILFLYYLLGGK